MPPSIMKTEKTERGPHRTTSTLASRERVWMRAKHSASGLLKGCQLSANPLSANIYRPAGTAVRAGKSSRSPTDRTYFC